MEDPAKYRSSLKDQELPIIMEKRRVYGNNEEKTVNHKQEVEDEQSDYNKCPTSLSSILREMPEEMRKFLRATTEQLPKELDMPPLPTWLDVQKLKKGQTFASNYMCGLNYSHAMSLLFLFALTDGLKPLIYTEKSHTPDLAFDQYLSMVVKVKSWQETEIWKPTSEGYKNLRAVRSLYLRVSDSLNDAANVHEIHHRCSLEMKLKACDVPLMSSLSSILKTDFEAAVDQPLLYQTNSHHVYMNQMEMCWAQFGFYGLILLYPDKFGAKSATEEELEGFLHLWRYVGHMLGIKDEYNLCGGHLKAVRRRSILFVDYFVRPIILRAVAIKEWEHMTRCAILGIQKFFKWNINFESMMIYFCWVLHIKTPYLESFVGWKETFSFSTTKLILTKGHKIPGFIRFLNYNVRRNIEAAAANRTKSKGRNYTLTPTHAKRLSTFTLMELLKLTPAGSRFF